jgi:hypothetical protein
MIKKTTLSELGEMLAHVVEGQRSWHEMPVTIELSQSTDSEGQP